MNGIVEASTLVGQASIYKIWIEPARGRNKSKLILEVGPEEESGKPRRLPFDANYFDSVIFRQKHPLRTTLFQECLRVLKEGGVFSWSGLKEKQIHPARHLLIYSGLIGVEDKEIKLGGEVLPVIGGIKPVQFSRH